MTPELVKLLLLIIIANATPVLLRFVSGGYFDKAIDAGRKLSDGNRVFGDSKTWRGIAGATAITAIAAWLMAWPAWLGAVVAITALSGDLLSSFIKRRLGLSSGSMAPLLDQVPESLLPALCLMGTLSLSYPQVLILVILFIVAELVLSRIFYMLGVRKSPY